ncbi:FaeA/PapI family transcriptional regulator [Pseudoduganella rivuli]|nr:FaeA/PapI family transcriptional regulator [Pseudoduganella rivuli]
MIAQHEIRPRARRGMNTAQERSASIRQNIVDYLGRNGAATVQTLAAQFSATADQVRGYLTTLNTHGKVRRIGLMPAEAGRPSAMLWELGADDELPDEGAKCVRWGRAVQTGDVARDPLVVALFGPASAVHEVRV